MVVYLLWGDTDYESIELLGCFSTVENMLKEYTRLRRKWREYLKTIYSSEEIKDLDLNRDRLNYDYVRVTEYRVDKSGESFDISKYLEAEKAA